MIAVLLSAIMNYQIEQSICKSSIFYFMEKYLELDLKQPQIDDICHIIDMENSNHYEILAERRSGVTTTIIVAALWYAMFNKSAKIAICAKNYCCLRENINLIDKFLSSFDSHIPKEYRTYYKVLTNYQKINFSNGSEIYFLVDVENSIRGINFEYIFADNTRYPQNYPYMYSRLVVATTRN